MTELEEVRAQMNAALSNLMQYPRKVETPEQVVELFGYAREFEDITKEFVELAREKMLALIRTAGEQIPDGKGKQLIVNGLRVEARLSRNGLDPKKVQAWLAAKGLPAERALSEKVTYVLNPQTEQFLREDGAGDDVLVGLHHDEPTWSVQRPVAVKEEE